MSIRYDSITVKADVTAEGWIVDKPVITRAGIFSYHNAQGKVVREYRPAEEVFSADSLSSLRAIPITDGHRGMVNATHDLDNVIVGSVMSPGEKQDEINVVADVVIHNVKRIGARRELSLGYICSVEDTPGELNGQRYDCIQRNIRYNHLAVVHKGRAGNARLRLDADDASSFLVETDMVEVTLSKVRFDNGLEYPAAPEVVVRIDELVAKLKDLQTRADKSEGERDAAKAELSKMVKDHEAALKAERSAAKQRLALESKADQLNIKFDGLSDRELKEAIVKKLGNDLNFAERSDDYVGSAYDLAISHDDAKSKTTAKQKTATTAKQDSKPGGSISSMDARAKMIARIRGEKEAA
jgi:uncharacterized protein